MPSRCATAALIAAAVLAVPACSSIPGALSSSSPPTAEMSDELQATFSAAGFGYGEYARWPDQIPADIPPLEGEIDSVMNAPGLIRIFYSAVSEEKVSEYLQNLQTLGFELEYIVYTAPSVPDEQTAERIARGEWDAVDITRGSYRMRLETGAGQATFDIDTAGFPAADPSRLVPPTFPVFPTNTLGPWPSEIPDRIPQPPSCGVVSGGPTARGGYMAIVKCTESLAFQGFVDALLAAGFSQTNPIFDSNNRLLATDLQDSEFHIVVATNDPSRFSTFSIVIDRVAP